MAEKSATVPETVPKVEFRVASPDEFLPALYFFLNSDLSRSRGFDHWIYHNYPELKEKLQPVSDIGAREATIRTFFEEIFTSDREKIEHSAEQFQKEWDRINDGIMLALEEIVQTSWPATFRRFTALVGPDPNGPRHLQEKSFQVYYRRSPYDASATAIHELLHFIYFEKWWKIFPETRREEFEAPNLVWKLSEMVPRVILRDQKIQAVFKCEFKSHTVFEDAVLDGKPLLSYIQEFYDNRTDFEDFLRKSWEFVKAHEKEIP